ncbi:uncharacterized protein LOC108111672 [Drosophila eugracilis]|uniref:uncharacterized protein LOC108111672 n=1 Tax=Drosophila eugracilis TaxID=29029 RepID=UPI0007E5F267|nr:uncharacterized protein LOC108111672 [Drosophila eugracilis]
MRIDAQIMWLIIVLFSLLASATGSHYRTRRKQRQALDSRLIKRYAGAGEGRSTCDMNDQDNLSPIKPMSNPGNAKQRASGIAMQAASEAKKANEDMAAAVKVAADKIKNEYAEKATAAAKAAEAVLSGKSQVLEQLEAEVREAEMVVQEENQELTTAEANAQLATKALNLGHQELKTLTVSLKFAKDNREISEQVHAVWQQSLCDKTALLEAAQRRVSVLMRQLSEARIDFEKTKKSALNAARAAQEAKQRIEHPESCNESGRGRICRDWRQYNENH